MLNDVGLALLLECFLYQARGNVSSRHSEHSRFNDFSCFIWLPSLRRKFFSHQHSFIYFGFHNLSALTTK